MPDQGDTEILQILGRQAREHFFVDLVVAERLLVTLKTKAAQPRLYVHAVILGSEERQPLKDDDSSKSPLLGHGHRRAGNRERQLPPPVPTYG